MVSTSGKTTRCNNKNASRAKILGVALAAVFLAGSALATAPEPISCYDASSTDYGIWHVGDRKSTRLNSSHLIVNN